MLGAVAGAEAAVLVRPDGAPVGGAWQTWVDRSKVPTAPGPVLFAFDHCPRAVGGCYWGYPDWDGRPREVRISPLLTSGNGWRREALLHELGHDFDAHVMTGAARRRFMVIMRYPTAPWRGPHGEVQPPIERFADAYSECAIYGAARDQEVEGKLPGFANDPTPHQHRRVCSLIRRVGYRGSK